MTALARADIAEADIAEAYRLACRAELDALKPGNIHVFSAGAEADLADFAASADVSAPPLARAGASVGARIEGAIAATHARVGWNTNLGIVLLCAPLAAAAEEAGALEEGLARVLARLDLADAAHAFAAIRLASPGGLGAADAHDVAAPPAADLRAAMAAAAGRDRIARAYVTDFRDVFRIGLPVLRRARAAGLAEPWCATRVHMTFLADEPDTHILRKFGPDAAESVRARAAALLAMSESGPENRDALAALDADLRKEGYNPGTCADFTVATLFLDRLLGMR